MKLEQEIFSELQPADEVCLQGEQSRKQKQETPKEMARCRQLAASSGQEDLQKLLADHLVQSLRDRSRSWWAGFPSRQCHLTQSMAHFWLLQLAS